MYNKQLIGLFDSNIYTERIVFCEHHDAIKTADAGVDRLSIKYTQTVQQT